MIQVDQQDYQLVTQSLNDFILTYRSSTLKQKPLQKVEFDFELKSSRLLGRATLQKNRTASISINYEAYSQNRELYIQKILSHEFVHIINNLIHRNPKPHGVEFKYICSMLFPNDLDIGLSVYRGSDFALKRKKTYKMYPYRCRCKLVYLTSIRHNRVKKGTIYFCKKCGSRLIYSEV